MIGFLPFYVPQEAYIISVSIIMEDGFKMFTKCLITSSLNYNRKSARKSSTLS